MKYEVKGSLMCTIVYHNQRLTLPFHNEKGQIDAFFLMSRTKLTSSANFRD